MKQIIENILNRNGIFKSDPSSIALIEFYSKKNGLKPYDFYLFDKAKRFHKNSIERNNSENYYMDYNKYLLTENFKDGRYYDDLSFKEEKENKIILKQLAGFIKTQVPDFCEETINKILHMINELERNVRNHAYEDAKEMLLSYSGNFYYIPNNESYITINISDYGIGFKGRQNDDKSYSVLYTQGYADGDQFVLDAVKKKVSTFTNANKVASDDNKNSGYGLYLFNKVASTPSNKLDILSNGMLFSNDYGKEKMKFIGTWPEFDGITSITISFRVSDIEKILNELSDEISAFSTKSQYKSLEEE